MVCKNHKVWRVKEVGFVHTFLLYLESENLSDQKCPKRFITKIPFVTRPACQTHKTIRFHGQSTLSIAVSFEATMLVTASFFHPLFPCPSEQAVLWVASVGQRCHLQSDICLSFNLKCHLMQMEYQLLVSNVWGQRRRRGKRKHMSAQKPSCNHQWIPFITLNSEETSRVIVDPNPQSARESAREGGQQ